MHLLPRNLLDLRAVAEVSWWEEINQMKKLGFFSMGLFLALVSPQVHVGYTTTTTRVMRPNMYRGAFNVMGRIAIGSDTFGNSFTKINPSLAYFIDPKIAVGGTVTITNRGG